MNTSSSTFFRNNVRVGDSLREQPVPVESLPPTVQNELGVGVVNTSALQPAEGRFLGKTTEYKFTYDKTLLNPVPRTENRIAIGIQEDKLPFIGVDVWNCYEVSCLTTKGLPVVGIAKICYPCDSKYLIESKSLKLYLNSFNMERIDVPDSNITLVRMELAHRISLDLSEALGTNVIVTVHEPESSKLTGPKQFTRYSDFSENDYVFNITDLDHYVRESDLLIENYTETPSLLKCIPIDPKLLERKPTMAGFSSNLLRSNCKITKQPDWGKVVIGITANYNIGEVSLLKYIISFRNENHFHEEICETIFKRLYDIFNPSELIVGCFYTRRGGIDINPIRASHQYLITSIPFFEQYTKSGIISPKTSRQ